MTEEKKRDNFQKQLMMIFGAAFAVILILSAGLYFLGRDIKENAGRIENLRKELSSRSKAIESLTLLRRQSEEARFYSPDLDNILINRDQLVNFSRDIAGMAKQEQIDLSSGFSGESPPTAEGTGKVGLTITATGQFYSFVQFLKTLENSGYFVKLNLFDFVRQGDKFKILSSGGVFFFNIDENKLKE